MTRSNATAQPPSQRPNGARYRSQGWSESRTAGRTQPLDTPPEKARGKCPFFWNKLLSARKRTRPTPPHPKTNFLALLTTLLLTTTLLPAQTIAPFTFPDTASATRAWKPGTRTPAVKPNNTVTTFPAPLTRVPDRVYWDHAKTINLAGTSAFELDFSCPQPEAIRSIGLHFRTGTGWYTAMIPLTRGGLQRRIISKADFSKEENPKPWSAITGVRLSLWKDKSHRFDTTFNVHALRAVNPQVTLYQATASEVVASERTVARRATERIADWLSDLYLSHGVVTDETISKTALKHTRVLVLPYNRSPGPKAAEAIRDLIHRGGKLIVCHDTSSTVADLLGVSIERLVESKIAGRWSAVRFNRNKEGAWPWPERIQQNVWNIIRATPKTAAARVLAHWESADGTVLRDIAAIESNRGIWFSQVFRDGDARHKQRLFLAMLGQHIPDVWRQAADSRLAQSPRRLGTGSLPELQNLIARQAKANGKTNLVTPILNILPQQQNAIRQAVQNRRYRDAVKAGFTLESNIQRAYAIAQAPQPELRGLWDQNGTGLYPQDWNRTCALLKKHGFNAIFPNVMWGGKAHYKSKFLPASGTLDNLGDQLTPLMAASKTHDIDVHLWKICWKVDTAPAAFRDRLKREGRLMRSATGKTVNWLCPAHEANQKLEINAVREAAARFKPAGIHLDYLRFPDRNTSFSPAMAARWKKAKGRDLHPNDADTPEFQAFRAQIITDFLTRIRAALRETDPNIKLSVAVWPEYPNTIAAIGQDYGAWLKHDLVDFLCPMNYTADPAQFDTWIRKQSQLSGAYKKIIPGIGAISNEADLAPDEVIQQINLTRNRRLPGYVLFKLNPAVAEQVLPLLSAGTTRP